MDRARQIELLQADCATLLAAQQADPTAPAWAGLGWDRTELLGHLADVHRRILAQLQAGTAERIRFSEVAPAPRGDELPGAFDAGVAALVTSLEVIDLDETWPTWAGPQRGAFYPRRMAQEAAVHRWDGAGGEIDAALAVDGVDELLELFVPRLSVDRFASVDGSIHLHATDRDGEWLVRLSPEGVSYEHGHAKGDVALRGSAADLLLWSWNRVPVDDRFEVFGDAALLETWRTTVIF
ncbi:MAG: maleylpyruvate isomerase N-terminal domain-containing protein [Acidimicrobiales bacterium]